MSEFKCAATQYATRGWLVIPLKQKDKTPITPNGLKDGTTDLDQIERWYNRQPNANIGIVTGSKSGIFVLDVDPRHGGDEALAALKERVGGFPETLTATTGGGGMRRSLFGGNYQKWWDREDLNLRPSV